MSAVMWGQELALALTKCNAVIDDVDDSNDKKTANTVACGKKLKAALRELWKEAPTDVFDNTYNHLYVVHCCILISFIYRDQEEIIRIDRTAEKLGSIHHLRNAFDLILNVILMALDAPPVFMRTKALRALSQILTVDSTVLSNVGILLSRSSYTHVHIAQRTPRD
jgi:cohesin loading factor subunit SCC2